MNPECHLSGSLHDYPCPPFNSLHRLSSFNTLNTFGFWILTRTDLIHSIPPKKKVFLEPTLWKLLKNEERKDENGVNLRADVRRGEKMFPIFYYTFIVFFLL